MKNWLTTTCLIFVGLASYPAAQAGDGFPPFGAWAYGSGTPSKVRVRTSHFPHRTVYSARYAWGGYGNLGYVATPRIHHASFYQPIHRHHHWTYRPSLIYSSYVAPSYYVPSYYTAPVYYSPSLFYSSFAPTVVPTWSPLCTTLPYSVSQTDLSDIGFLISDASPPTTQPTATVERTLEAADAIMQAGGYREAARAYAQLSVRFGDSHQLFGRRFIAQLLSGDVEQASVIATAARLSGFEFRRDDLPGGSLAGLMIDDVQIESSTELLAARAIADGASSSLAAVGQWLLLAGDEKRSADFLAHAEDLDLHTSPTQPSQQLELSSSGSPSALVSLEAEL